MRLTLPEPHIPKEGFTDENDIFGYREFGERLAKLISDINEPLVITLDGPWGSGKSVFIKQWKGLMKEKYDGSVVYFDAFRNDIHDDAFLALAHEIHFLAEDTLGKKNKPTQAFLDKAKKVGKALMPTGLRLAAHIGTAGLLNPQYVKAGDDAIKAISDASRSETEEALEKTISEKLQKTKEERALLENFRKSLEKVSIDITKKAQKKDKRPLPLIFIIDELDRCRPPFALDVIERVKHLFSVPNVCFMLVMDLPQFETAIRGVYGEKFDAGKYLEKFYHLKVILPGLDIVDRKQRDKYLNHLWKTLNPKFNKSIFDRIFYEEIQFLANAYKLSFREIERVMTNIVLATATVNKNQWFVPPVVAGLCIMRQRRSDLYALAREDNLTWEDVKKFLKIGEDDGSNTEYSRKWVIIWWQCLVDKDPPQDVLDSFSQDAIRYNLRGRLSSLHILTNFIDNLPNPTENPS